MMMSTACSSSRGAHGRGTCHPTTGTRAPPGPFLPDPTARSPDRSTPIFPVRKNLPGICNCGGCPRNRHRRHAGPGRSTSQPWNAWSRANRRRRGWPLPCRRPFVCMDADIVIGVAWLAIDCDSDFSGLNVGNLHPCLLLSADALSGASMTIRHRPRAPGPAGPAVDCVAVSRCVRAFGHHGPGAWVAP